MIALVFGVIAASIETGVDVAGIRLDIDEDRDGAEQDDDFGGGDEGERGGDDFVARLDTQRHQAR